MRNILCSPHRNSLLDRVNTVTTKLMYCIVFTLIASLTCTAATQFSFTGSIGKIPIQLELTADGEAVFGTLTYVKKAIPFSVSGTLIKGDLQFREVQTNGTISGLFMTNINKDGRYNFDLIKGDWIGMGKKAKNLKFQLTKVSERDVPRPVVGVLTGEYSYKYEDKESGAGSLLVEQIGKNQIAVEFYCVSGGPSYHIADIPKTILTLRDNTATYMSNEFGKCEFVIAFVPGGAVIEYRNDGYDCGFGMRASVVGSYRKTSDKKPKFSPVTK